MDENVTKSDNDQMNLAYALFAIMARVKPPVLVGQPGTDRLVQRPLLKQWLSLPILFFIGIENIVS